MAALAGPTLSAGESPDQPAALLARFCYSCHSSAQHKGDFDLERLGAPDPKQASQWEQVRMNLAERTMPPRGKPQPNASEHERIIAWIDRGLDGPDDSDPSDPGLVSPRRLTRLEFNRTIEDLLGVAGDHAAAFPADSAGGSGGFDNSADGLFVSPVFLELLLDVALRVVEQAKPERLDLVAPVPDKSGAWSPQARRRAVEASLASFLPRAWRRPVTPAEVQALVQIYLRSTAQQVTHDDAVRLTYAAALTSPNFIFRIEAAKPGTAPYPVSPFELATRLSYFLWSTMPDKPLLEAARDGSLAQPAVLAAQTRRMLADPRAAIMSRLFISQWLGTDSLATGTGPDAKFFPVYTPALRAAMIEEPVVFLNALLAGDRSLIELIDCDYAFVDPELAKHYQFNHPGGEGFARVAITDGRRGGLVTMAGVLTVTSRGDRTSPVLRGKWILDELLSAPPPPPPPNVKALAAPKKGAVQETLRQRLERHRADPSCTACHLRIDPLGFGLENFDALGRWRDSGDGGLALDTVGNLPSGETFSGPKELKLVLMQRKERVMTTVIERMLSYALGRNLERCDRPTVRRIQAALAKDGWRAQTLVVEIVQSLPFRFKRNQVASEARARAEMVPVKPAAPPTAPTALPAKPAAPPATPPVPPAKPSGAPAQPVSKDKSP